jgi:antitoxin VapB
MRGTKLFRHGRSQAVQLPPEYRFEGSEVHIRRAPSSGDVVLSRRPESWEEFFELLKTIDVPQDFLPDRDDARERKNAGHPKQKPPAFADDWRPRRACSIGLPLKGSSAPQPCRQAG